jgi:hypothetical protein
MERLILANGILWIEVIGIWLLSNYLRSFTRGREINTNTTKVGEALSVAHIW